ncbi:MAG: hypothetical protein ABSH16_05665 [Sedimentisphaerales bacterium]
MSFECLVLSGWSRLLRCAGTTQAMTGDPASLMNYAEVFAALREDRGQ